MDHISIYALNKCVMKISDLMPVRESKLKAVLGKIAVIKPESAQDQIEQNITMHRSPKAGASKLG